MLGALARHSLLVVLITVVLDELGLPPPVPIDLMIVFAGATVGAYVPQLALFCLALTLASAFGGSGLYLVMRRGGRPLIDRYGRYVRLGPERLARAEALLARGGWGGIALGRAVPGLRYATVIACGLLKVPYVRFVTAHTVGSSAYTAVFLTLGAILGPTVLDHINLPALGVRLLWLLPLAVGLPLLIVWWGRRVRHRRPADLSRGRLVGAVLLGSFAGTAALAATVSATTTIAELLGVTYPPGAAYALPGWLLGLQPGAQTPFLPSYAVLLALLVGVAVAYYGLVLPYLAPRGIPPLRQVLGLALLALFLLGLFLLSSPFVALTGPLGSWWRTGGPTVSLGVALGVAAYALTTVYGSLLAVTVVAPTLRRGTPR